MLCNWCNDVLRTHIVHVFMALMVFKVQLFVLLSLLNFTCIFKFSALSWKLNVTSRPLMQLFLFIIPVIKSLFFNLMSCIHSDSVCFLTSWFVEKGTGREWEKISSAFPYSPKARQSLNIQGHVNGSRPGIRAFNLATTPSSWLNTKNFLNKTHIKHVHPISQIIPSQIWKQHNNDTPQYIHFKCTLEVTCKEVPQISMGPGYLSPGL
jgi:hypothetical protein